MQRRNDLRLGLLIAFIKCENFRYDHSIVITILTRDWVETQDQSDISQSEAA